MEVLHLSLDGDLLFEDVEVAVGLGEELLKLIEVFGSYHIVLFSFVSSQNRDGQK